jgi:hypothetical protein
MDGCEYWHLRSEAAPADHPIAGHHRAEDPLRGGCGDIASDLRQTIPWMEILRDTDGFYCRGV